MSGFKRRKVKSAKTLGQRLESARRRKKVSLEKVEEATKIRVRYLKAIEADQYKSLPSPVYLVGFLASYAEYLGLSPEDIVGQYKKERGVASQVKRSKDFRAGKELSELGFTITPKTIAIIIIALGVVGLFGYIGWQVKRFSSPPPVEIVSPSTDSVNKDNIVVKGYTAETAEVKINDVDISVGDDGLFSQEIGLHRGVNTIEIKATNRIGKETVEVLKIFADFAVSANPPADQ